MPADEQPKIIIDSDWKSQAQAEKARLEEEAAKKQAQAKPGAPGSDEPVSFEEICRMLAVQALTFLGEIPDPRTQQRVFAPELSKLYIDMLGVLEQKTKGNLTKAEDEFLTGLLQEARMAFVEVSKAVAKAVQEGKIRPQGDAPGAPGVVVTPGAPAAPKAPGLHTP